MADSLNVSVIMSIALIWGFAIIPMIVLFEQSKFKRGKILDLKFNEDRAQSEEVQGILKHFRILLFTLNPGTAAVFTVILTTNELLYLPILVYSTLVCFVALPFTLVYWTRKRLIRLKEEMNWSDPSERFNSEDEVADPDGRYTHYGLYANKNDPRVLIPQHSGDRKFWTFNLAHRRGKALVLPILLIPILILFGMAFTLFGVRSYHYNFEGERLRIRAPLFKTVVERKDIASLEVREQLPPGTRISGYMSKNQSFGRFDFPGIGVARIYTYTGSRPYLLLWPKDPTQPPLIVQQRSGAETERLRREIQKWLEEARP